MLSLQHSMVKLRIDNMEVQVPEGTTLLKASEQAGVEIPTMCFMEGFTNHPSCMICLVKDRNSGQLFASCAMPVAEGMEIITSDEEVREARKEALELLLSDHVGDCEAPCRNGCPAFMDIPMMNRLIAGGRFREALATVKEEIALPLILGYICEAPCEKVCRREPIDGAVSICQLKKFVAREDLAGANPYFPEKKTLSGKKVAVVGSGPAGLAAAFYLLGWGHQCIVFDINKKPGGSLLEVAESILPEEARLAEINYLRQYGVEFRMGQNVDGSFLESELMSAFDAVILATGMPGPPVQGGIWPKTDDKGFIAAGEVWETNLPGVFACGSAVRKQSMAIRAVAQGKDAAHSVNDYLLNKDIAPTTRKFNSKFGKLSPGEFGEYLKESILLDRMSPERGDLAGYRSDEAGKEAARCMHCDCRKPATCKLRIYADEYKADRKKYLSGERKPVSKQFSHENIVYEEEKCIKCGLCVEITARDKELTGLTFIGRGFDVRIGVPFTRELGEALTRTAEKCARACPTAAISLIKEKEL